MANYGNGYIKLVAGEDINVTYKVRRSRASAHHIVINRATKAAADEFLEVNFSDCEYTFRLDAGTYDFSWSVLALTKAASVVMQLESASKVLYRREAEYSGSGAPPRGRAIVSVGEV